jgi:hypothetical protein
MSRFGRRCRKITTLCLMLEEGAAASSVEDEPALAHVARTLPHQPCSSSLAAEEGLSLNRRVHGPLNGGNDG